MKLVILIVLGVTVALQSVHATSVSSKSDTELSRQIIGSWENGVPRGIITFFPDQAFRGFWIVKTATIPPARVDIKGSWRIEGGMLMGNISSSSAPSVVPPGKLKGVRIISISAEGSLLQDAKGQTERHPRARIPSVLPPLLSSDIGLFIGKPKGSKAMINRSILERPAPVYPQNAIRDHKSGSGAFGLLISTSTGRVESVRTLVSTGHEVLDEAARGSLVKWRFKSDSIDKLVVPVEFKLTKRGPLGIFGL